MLKIAVALVFIGSANATLANDIDQVIVNKSELLMYLMSGAEVMHTYDISLGDNPSGHKQQEGDERTPEGRYTLDWRNPNSRYYKSIHISYPDNNDVQQANLGNRDPGGDIFIHGLPNGYRLLGNELKGTNWTDGCIAVNDNAQMEEIWTLVKDGTPIHILP